MRLERGEIGERRDWMGVGLERVLFAGQSFIIQPLMGYSSSLLERVLLERVFIVGEIVLVDRNKTVPFISI